MPEELKQKSSSTASSPPPATEKRKPALRTMQSDIATLFKTTRPSLIKILGEELSQPPPPAGEPKKRWGMRQLVVAGGGAFLIFLIGGGVWFWASRGGGEIAAPPKLIPPPPFFATERGRTISAAVGERVKFLRLMEDALKEKKRRGTMERIIIKLRDGPQERFATAEDFFTFYRITPPEGFLRSLDGAPMFFTYTSADGIRFGIAVRTRDQGRTLRDLLLWEPSLFQDFRELMVDEEPQSVLGPFEERTYRNIDWRFLKLSQKEDLGMGYTIFTARNVLVITTSREAMETVIDRLFAQ